MIGRQESGIQDLHIGPPKPLNLGYCPHPVTVYTRGPIKGFSNYITNIIQLLLSGGSTQPKPYSVNYPAPWPLGTKVVSFPFRNQHEAPNLTSHKCYCIKPSSPPRVDRIWGIWGSYYNIPKAIFYLLKGDYKP